MEICPNCNTKLPKDALFCGSCGQKVDKKGIYATPTRRSVGFLIDSLLYYPLTAIPLYILSLINPKLNFMDLMGFSNNTNSTFWLGLIISILIYSTYYTVMLALKGATIGKMITKQKVVTIENKPIGWKEAIIREFVSWISSLALGLGYIWILWDNKRQTWHDKVAKTVVIKVNQ